MVRSVSFLSVPCQFRMLSWCAYHIARARATGAVRVFGAGKTSTVNGHVGLLPSVPCRLCVLSCCADKAREHSLLYPVGILAVAGINQALVYNNTSYIMMIGSFGASAVLLYSAWEVPLAQPRNLIGGHVLSAIVGVTIQYEHFL